MEWILIPICIWCAWIGARAVQGEKRLEGRRLDVGGAAWTIAVGLFFLMLIARL